MHMEEQDPRLMQRTEGYRFNSLWGAGRDPIS